MPEPAAGPPPAGGPPGDGGRRSDRTPGWREVLLVAAIVLAAVFAVELLSSLVPPVGAAFSGFPVTIVVLVAGTVGLLLVIGLRRPRG